MVNLQDIITPTLTLPHQGGGEKADSLRASCKSLFEVGFLKN